MCYKLIVKNIDSSPFLLQNSITTISNFYILFPPTFSFNYYIIYFIENNKHELTKLIPLNDIIISSVLYNKIVYKIFKLFLLNNNKEYIFIDFQLHNINNIKIFNLLKIKLYLHLFNLNNNVRLLIYNFIKNVDNNITYIYHNNVIYLNFIKRYLYNIDYSSIIFFMFNNYHTLYKKLKSILKNQISKIYLICDYINSESPKLTYKSNNYIESNNSINNDYSKIIKKIIYKLNNYNIKFNLLILSNKKVNLSNHNINFFTFSHLFN